MKFFQTILLSALLSLCSATPIKKSKAPLVLNINIKKGNITSLVPISKATNAFPSLGNKRLATAASFYNISIPNESDYYLGELSVGSDSQTVGVIVDTGSSDLWFPAESTCTSSDACDEGGFDEDSSTSYSSLGESFAVYYGTETDETYAKGTWGTDTVTWGGATVTAQQFGLATDQDIGEGIIGIGYTGNEGADTEYLNFPAQLVSQGLIDKNAYSLYLNSPDASSGTIIFGGIDTAKFSGDLTYLDIIDINDEGETEPEAVAFFVSLKSLSQGDDTLVSSSQDVLLDSGTTLIYASASEADAIGEKYGTYNSEVGAYLVDSCDGTGDDFVFEFDGVSISVPYTDLLIPALEVGNTIYCALAILNSGEDIWILGDYFLRSAYVYYDLEADQVGIAPVVYTSDSSITSV